MISEEDLGYDGAYLSYDEVVQWCKDCIHGPAAHGDCPLIAHYIVTEGYCHIGREKDEQGEI